MTLYFIGGATRAGKSTLARRVIKKTGLPFLHLDCLMMGLILGVKAWKLDGETDDMIRARRMWPVLKNLIGTMIDDTPEQDYLFDGVIFLPEHLAELQSKYQGKKMRGVWLGYTKDSLAEKKQMIMNDKSADNWLRNKTDERINKVLNYGVSKSRQIKRRCEKFGLPYYDFMPNCEKDLLKVEKILLAKS